MYFPQFFSTYAPKPRHATKNDITASSHVPAITKGGPPRCTVQNRRKNKCLRLKIGRAAWPNEKSSINRQSLTLGDLGYDYRKLYSSGISDVS